MTRRGREGRVDGRAGQEMLSFDVQNSKELCTSTVDLHRGRDLVAVGGRWRLSFGDSVA